MIDLDAFRSDAQRLARRTQGRRAARLRGDHPPGARRCGHRLAEAALRRRVGGHPLARRPRRPRSHARPQRDLDRGVRPRRCARVHQHGRDRPRRNGHPEVRHRGAEARPPEGDPGGRAGVVPALLRARRRQRPRVALDARRARRRAMDRQRPEGLDERRALLGLGHPHGPHRSRRAEAQGDLVLPHGHGTAGHRGASAPPDDRRSRVRRGVLHRRRDADRRADRPRERGLDGRAWRRSPASAATSAHRSSGSSVASSRSPRSAPATSAPSTATVSPRCSRAGTPTARSRCGKGPSRAPRAR